MELMLDMLDMPDIDDIDDTDCAVGDMGPPGVMPDMGLTDVASVTLPDMVLVPGLVLNGENVMGGEGRMGSVVLDTPAVGKVAPWELARPTKAARATRRRAGRCKASMIRVG